MPKATKNLLGKRFGKLLVSGGPDKTRYGRTYWVCLCDCGEERFIAAHNLIGGRSVSCGCSRAEHPNFKTPKKQSHKEAVKRIAVYRNRAEKKDLDWSLTEDEAKKLLKGDCYYCGISPNDERAHRIMVGQEKPSGFNGIDRVDNSEGYAPGNTVSCCWWCNLAKNNRSTEEFVEWLERVHYNLSL